MSEQATFEHILAGTPEMVEELFRLFGEEGVGGLGRFRITRLNNPDFPATIDLRVNDNKIIGRFALIGLPGNRTLLRIPQGRYTRWEDDPDGRFLARILDSTVKRFEEYGLLSRRSRFTCASMVETAIRQLTAADSPEGYASIGSVYRTALIALARELFDPAMLTQGEAEPAGDAAGAKLKVVARFHWGGRSSRQLGGMKKQIDGTWDMCVAFLHRQSATREEAEIVLSATVQLFDMISLVLP